MLASSFLLFGLNRVALVEMGVPLERVGWIVGTIGPVVGLPAIAIAGAAATRWGSPAVFAAFAALGVLCGLTWAMAAFWSQQNLAIAATLIGAIALVGSYVMLVGTMMRWSAGERPATDFATFYGLGNLAAMLPMAGAGFVAGQAGWPVFYLVAVVIYAIAAALMHSNIRT